MRMRWALAASGLVLAATSASGAPSPVADWMPDILLTGEQIDGAARGGDAEWHVEGEVIVARPGPSGAGGWLILGKPLQDVAAFVEFRCTDPCDAGLVIRSAEISGGGLEGTIARFGSGASGLFGFKAAADNAPQYVRLDASEGQSRFAVPPGGAAAGAAPSVPGVDNPLRRLFPRVEAPLVPLPGHAANAGPGLAAPAFAPPGPSRSATVPAGFVSGEWNRVELLADTNVARASVNDGRREARILAGGADGFGPVALYVGPGSGEVRFRNFVQKDLGSQYAPAETGSRAFRGRKLDDFSYAWDTAIADVDRDGHKDLIAGPYYYLGPDFTRRRELYIASTFSPGNQYAANMITHAHDFTGDGWPDILVTEARQMALLVNPRGEARRWDRHMVVPGNVSELTLLDDLDGDGRCELIMVQGGKVAIAQPRPGAETAPWPVFFISSEAARLHSFGVGDIDGDGRKDIVQAGGWWAQPDGGLFAAEWRFHRFLFANPEHPEERVEGGGEMAVVDVNGDGLADIISSINAHGFGLAWYEQRRRGGEIDFMPHLIMGDYRRANPGGLTVSQLHAGVVAADVDGDGVVDFFTGKKRWAHLDSHADPDPASPAYLLLYRGKRDPAAPGGIRFEPEVLSNRAGAGSALTVEDIDGDGRLDVATSGVDGTWVFHGVKYRKRKQR